MNTQPSARLANRNIQGLIRYGEVIAVDYEALTCTVRSGTNTYWGVRFLTPRAGKVREWNAPAVGERVMLSCPDRGLESPVVWGSGYNEAFPAPSKNADVHLIQYEQGNLWQFDHGRGEHKVIAGEAEMTVGPQVITLRRGAVEISIAADDSITVSTGGMVSTTGGQITSTGATITLTGAVTVNGPLSVAGPIMMIPGVGGIASSATMTGNVTVIGGMTALTVEAGGIDLATHTHTGVRSGTASTGAPQ